MTLCPPHPRRSPLLRCHHLPSSHTQTLLYRRTGVFLCSGYAIPQTGGLKGNKNWLSQFWRLECETKALADFVSGEGPLLGSYMASLCIFTQWKGGGISLASVRRALILFIRAHPADSALPKGPPTSTNTITRGSRFQYTNFGGTQTSQSIAMR